MYFIAYVKQKLKNHVSVFTGNCDQEDIQMKDSMNWKETQLVYGFQLHQSLNVLQVRLS